MKFRGFVLLFLFGLLGVIAVSCSGDESGSSSPNPPLPSKVESAERAITDALNKIPKGDVYHNVPKEMQVGISDTIEAGIAPKVTEQIRKRLQGRGEISVESGVRFDPSGMEMKLVTQPNEFEVLEVKGGEQFVTANTPGRWIWRVKPLKAGDNLIVIKAIVKLHVPEIGVTRPVEVEVFSAPRTVKVNLAYSIEQFVTNNWKEVLGLLVGSGSLASLVTWWISKKDEKKDEKVKESFSITDTNNIPKKDLRNTSKKDLNK